MARPVGFWTKKRLRELLLLSKTMHVHQLAKYFDRPADSITEALIFYQQHKKLKIEVVRRRKYTITRYAPGYARGVTSGIFDEERDDDDKS